MTVADYLKKVVSQTGENIKIERFVRFVVGEEDED
jgi:translation elongation factor EF-Ts